MLSTLAHECLCCIAVLLLFDWIALYQATESYKVDAKRSDKAAQGAIFTHTQTSILTYTQTAIHMHTQTAILTHTQTAILPHTQTAILLSACA